jgi:hypothetical protein
MLTAGLILGAVALFAMSLQQFGVAVAIIGVALVLIRFA